MIRPIAPRISRAPVTRTTARGFGTQGGIIRSRSARIFPKCADPVNRNINASAQVVAPAQVQKTAHPKIRLDEKLTFRQTERLGRAWRRDYKIQEREYRTHRAYGS